MINSDGLSRATTIHSSSSRTTIPQPRTLDELQRGGLIARLYPWEEDLARIVGTGRTSENIDRADRRSYEQSRLMSSNLLANIHGAVVEIGVSRLIGAYCFAAVWPKHEHHRYAEALPDALRGEVEIEIKWRRTASSMPVDRKDVEADRVVLWAESKLASAYGCTCSPLCEDESSRETSRVRLLGGGPARTLWAHGKTYNGDSKRVAVPACFLFTCDELSLSSSREP